MLKCYFCKDNDLQKNEVVMLKADKFRCKEHEKSV